MAAIGVGIVLTRETLQVRWRAWIVEHLVDRWLWRPALLPSQRHRQGAAQPRIPHLRRHALGHRAAGRSRHRPACSRWWARPPSSASCGRSAAPITLRSGLVRPDHHPGLHGDRGAGLRLHRLRPDAVGRRAAGRLRRPQERGGGLFPLRHDAHPRQRRERGPDERRAATSRPCSAASTRRWWRAGWRSCGSTAI